MRTYERNGVHIEQCENCRGIFLDYGELETLTRMESQYHTPPAAPPAHGAPAHGAPAWARPLRTTVAGTTVTGARRTASSGCCSPPRTW
ncbi:zf-TFIIB domain-containing protein [Nonomuraea dietziae]|uniref:TFIIB-type zinc ribbon-containing protein n=1 Tax=Nonomuraea dietziae TaxID=65515 RepID=UPI00361E4DF9